MGIVKGVAKHKVGKGVDNKLDDMGKVGEAIDKHTTTGPLDAAEDKLDKARGDIGKRKKDGLFKNR